MKPIRITIYSDFICPFCFIGKGLVDELKKEFPLEDEWPPFELHPETPPEGVLLADAYPELDPEDFSYQMNRRGEPLGIRFGVPTRMGNSRLALEGAEFAKEQGLFSAYHDAVFRASFTDCRDIGNMDVLLAAAGEAGLDIQQFQAALSAGTYTERVVRSTQDARASGVNVTPTFLIPGREKIVGVKPLETFQAALGSLSS